MKIFLCFFDNPQVVMDRFKIIMTILLAFELYYLSFESEFNTTIIGEFLLFDL